MDPLQCSCLENPRDRGAWWAAVYGVTQSRTQLKRLSSSSRSSSWSRGLWNFPGGASGKEPSCKFRSHRRHRWSLGWEDPLEKGNGNPFQYFYPENPHGQRSLVGSSPWGHKELDTTEWLSMHACMHGFMMVLPLLRTELDVEVRLGFVWLKKEREGVSGRRYDEARGWAPLTGVECSSLQRRKILFFSHFLKPKQSR